MTNSSPADQTCFGHWVLEFEICLKFVICYLEFLLISSLRVVLPFAVGDFSAGSNRYFYFVQ